MDKPIHRWTAQALAVARHHNVLVTVAVVVPLSSMLTVLTTVTICLVIWRSGPSYKEGLVFPAISELGVDMPQKRVYQVGFGCCGALLSLGILFFEELVAPLLLPLVQGTRVRINGLRSTPQLNGALGVCQGPPDAASGRVSVQLHSGEVKAVKPENLVVEPALSAGAEADLLHSLIRWGHLSAAGVVLQGVFTLEHSVSTQCFIHWGGAMLFMMSSMQHGKASNELYDLVAKRSVWLLQDRLVARAFRLRHVILDYSSIVCFLIPLVMQMFPSNGSQDATSKNQSTAKSEQADFDPSMMNAMGVMQWGIILQFAVFFCTYTADLRAAAAVLAVGDGTRRGSSVLNQEAQAAEAHSEKEK